MTYSESAAGISITKSRAMLELRRHGVEHVEDFATFLTEMGDLDTYSASAVLAWLGY